MLRTIVSRCAPMTIGIAAFFLASAIGSLVDHAFVDDGVAPASIAPFAEARTDPSLAMLALLQDRGADRRN
jgi:hypothetical protein